MELRHLRYFLAVGEALNFTKAAAQLRVAQPALSRQVQDLEEELGVDLLVRSPRGVTLTAEGKLFLEEAREILSRTGEAMEKVRALARGEFGEIRVGYAPSPTVEILPPALAAFRKALPRVKISLHDLAGDELYAGLRDGSLDLALIAQSSENAGSGLHFELLRQYAFCVAVPPGHPFTKMKSVPVATLAVEPLVALSRKDYSEYHLHLENIFGPGRHRYRIATECDGASSLIADVESGHGVAVVTESFWRITGDRLVLVPLEEVGAAQRVGIARAVHADVTPAAERFCQMLREAASQLPVTKGGQKRT